jgi:hypothetical protein
MRLFALTAAITVAVTPVAVKAADLAPPPVVGLPEYGVAPAPAIAPPVTVAPQYSGAPFPPAVVAPPASASHRQCLPRSALPEPTCRREQPAPRFGPAAIAAAAGSRAVHRVPNFILAPMGRPVRRSTPIRRRLRSPTPDRMGRKSTRVRCALIPVIKPTEVPIVRKSPEA